MRDRAKSCPDIATDPASQTSSIGIGTFRPVKTSSTATEDSSTQTSGLLPYENLLLDVLDQRLQPGESGASSTMAIGPPGSIHHPAAELSRLSPSAMLERYIEVCARANCHTDARFSEYRCLFIYRALFYRLDCRRFFFFFTNRNLKWVFGDMRCRTS